MEKSPKEFDPLKRRGDEKDPEQRMDEGEEILEKTYEMQEKDKEHLGFIYDDLYEKDFFPVSVLQGSEVVELTGDKDIYGVENGRPFVVVEVIGTNEKSGDSRAIYKREIKGDNPYQSIKKESIIYQDILPEIYEKLPENIKEKVVFPEIINEIKDGNETKAIILEKIEGYICGDHDTTKKGVWKEEDIEAICFLIKEFQEIDPEKIQSKGFELPYKDFFESYQKRFKDRAKPARELMGEEYFLKIEEIFRNIKKTIQEQPKKLLSEDIFCYNTIKMPDGRNAFVDWERPYLGNDVSADYGKLISRLWTDPEMQKKAIEKALKMNQDNPDFKNLLKASLLFGEGGHMFKHYYKRLNNEDLGEKEEAKEAVKVFESLFKEILDNEGVWEK